MATTASTNAPSAEQLERRHPHPTLVIANDPVPLYVAPNGAVRVTGTRIPLENIVWDYERGGTPEEIVASFDTLKLADVYAVIAYFLHHRAEVTEYVRVVEALEDQIAQELEAQPGLAPLRERIKARWVAREQRTDASADR